MFLIKNKPDVPWTKKFAWFPTRTEDNGWILFLFYYEAPFTFYTFFGKEPIENIFIKKVRKPHE